MTLSDGEHKALRGWSTPEDRALRDMSLSAGLMVIRGAPDQFFLGIVHKCMCYGDNG